MPAAAPCAPPRVVPARIAALREDLERAEYTSERVQDLLGPMAAAALRREQAVPALRALADIDDPAARLFELFTLGHQLDARVLDAALPATGADGARELGIVALDGERVRALIDLAPYAAQDDLGAIRWWIASDLSELATGAPLHPEHVLGVGGASLTLASITPRERVGTALDMGCGCGIQALHASRHADRVVATDLSERAIAFATFTAALNGIDLDLRTGSLFEPVAGEEFDLIVSNPPFVITPRDAGIAEWTYRDGGRGGDELLADIARELPAHLAPGGSAVMLANWEIAAASHAVPSDAAASHATASHAQGDDTAADAPDGEDWTAHPRCWFEQTGLDVWVIQRDREDPAQYAETWARDGGVTDRDEAWPAMLSAWLDDFASRDVAGIGFGYVLAHRPVAPGSEAPRTAPLLDLEEVATTGSGSLGAHLARAFAARRALAALDDEALLEHRAVRAADVIERRHLTPGAWDPMLIELVQGGGLGRIVRADQLLAATVGACDGELTLGQIIGAVCALTDTDPQDAAAGLVGELRRLIAGGMLDLAAPAPDGPGPGSGSDPAPGPVPAEGVPA